MIRYTFSTFVIGSLWLYTTVVHAQAPLNDECINATVIRSDTTSLPYKSPFIEIELATVNIIDPIGNCSDFNITNWLSVWYKWEPNATDTYLFYTTEDNIGTAIELFRGSDCGSLVAVECDIDIQPSFETMLTANETYYIRVSADPEAVSDVAFRLVVNTTIPPPPNAVCSNATAVQAGDTVFGDLTYSTANIPPNEIECGSFFTVFSESPTLWYKVTNTNTTPIVIVASTCNDATVTDTVITVFKGNDCSALECVGAVDDPLSETCGYSAEYTFYAAPSTTYYIAVQMFDEVGNFTISFETKTSYFALIDASVDKVIGVVSDGLNYDQITSSALNIEAVFDDTTNIKSVMVTFDDQRSRCERLSPYSIFKDTDGDFWNGTISADIHSVTAESYSQPECQGEIGQTLTQTFFMEECTYDLFLYQVSLGDYFFGLDSLPCDDITIEALFDCGFDIEKVEFTLSRVTINNDGEIGRTSVIKSQTELFSPYFLFGNKGDVVNGGTINAGTYTIQVTVNGISFTPVSFEVGEDCGQEVSEAKTSQTVTPLFSTSNGKK